MVIHLNDMIVLCAIICIWKCFDPNHIVKTMHYNCRDLSPKKCRMELRATQRCLCCGKGHPKMSA